MAQNTSTSTSTNDNDNDNTNDSIETETIKEEIDDDVRTETLTENTNFNSNKRVCPVDSIYPNAACDVATQDELSCGYNYIWLGCSDEKLTYTPIMECSCNDPYAAEEGTWSCMVMSMAQFCDDSEAYTPALRLTSCTPEVEVEQQQQQQEEVDASVELQTVVAMVMMHPSPL